MVGNRSKNFFGEGIQVLTTVENEGDREVRKRGRLAGVSDACRHA